MGNRIIKKNKQPITISSFANHIHIYILAIGILLGILLGPGVLGQISPSTYSAMFSSSQVKQLSKISSLLKKHTKDELGHIKDSKITLDKLKEKLTLKNKQLAALNNAITRAHNNGAMHLVIALLIALVVIMLTETLLAPVRAGNKENESMIISPALGRVVTIRYCLIAGCLAVILSRPSLLESFTLYLAIIVIAITLILGLTPLGKIGKIR